MAGKRKHFEPKITKKDRPRMTKRKMKIDPREEMEKIKGLLATIAEQGAVQVKLIEDMDLLNQQPFDDWDTDTRSNLQLTLDHLRNLNIQTQHLDAAVRDYTDEMLAVLISTL